MNSQYERSQRRLRALKSRWRARHQTGIRIEPEIAPEYKRRFYAALHGGGDPAYGLLAAFDELGA